MRGEELTEEETELMNVPRSTKYKKEDDKGATNAKNAKGKKPARGGRGKKQDKKAEKEEEVPEEKVYTSWPKSENATMVELKNFLSHLETDRLIEINLGRKEKARVREEEEFSQIHEEGQLSIEDSLSHLMKFDQTRQDLKTQRENQRDLLVTQLEEEKAKNLEEFNRVREEMDRIDKLLQQNS